LTIPQQLATAVQLLRVAKLFRSLQRQYPRARPLFPSVEPLQFAAGGASDPV
jgi:hypothetical protein